MCKYLVIPAVLIFLFACNPNATTKNAHRSLADSLHTADTGLKVIGTERLIVPGKRIGNIYINGNADSLATSIGKPNSNYAAMGGHLMKWPINYDKKKYLLSVYALKNEGVANEAKNYIADIRVTSPWYKTADYSGAGSELKDIKKLYKLKMHTLTKGSKTEIYDASTSGIAFEVDSTGRCSAVLIHVPNDTSSTYLHMR